MPEAVSNEEGAGFQKQVLDQLFALTEKTGKALEKAASVTKFLYVTIPIVATAIGGLAWMGLDIKDDVSDVNEAVARLETAVTSPTGLTASIGSLVLSQQELTKTVGKLENRLDVLKKKQEGD